MTAEITETDRFDLTDAGHAVLAESVTRIEALATWKATAPRRSTGPDGATYVSHPAPPAEAVAPGQVWIPGLPVLVRVN